MRIIFYYTLIVLFVLAAAGHGQMADRADIGNMKQDYLGLKPAGKPFSLIDFSRLHWTHSYSIGFFSGGGTSGSMGMYTGNIFYEFSPSLSLNLKLGIAHNPGSLFDRSLDNNATFFPGLQLDYHPSPNLSISAGFDTYPGGYYLYNPYYNRANYWRRNLGY